MIAGVDVSSYQPLDTIRQRIDEWRFGLVKVTEGVGYVSPLYARQLALFSAHGKPIGLYHFLRGDASGRAQWRHFAAHAAAYRGRAVVFCDHEHDETGRLVPDKVARDFIRAGHAAGYRVGRYGSEHEAMLRNLGEDWRLVAAWGTQRPPRCDIWQSTGTGAFDADWFLGPDLHAFWLRNSYQRKPSPLRRIIGRGGWVRRL